MGVSSSKTKTKTTPIVSQPMQGNLNDFAGRVADFARTDPGQYVAPASALQTQAFNSTGNLGQGQAALNTALGMAQDATSAPIPQAALSQASTSTYTAPRLGNAAQAGAVNIAPVTNAVASTVTPESLLQNFQAYLDPSTQALVDTTLANSDLATTKARAQALAQAAGAKAFGDRSQFYMADFDQTGLAQRAQLENQLRTNAYTQGINASNMDASRRQEAGTTNASLATQVSGMNAGAANNRASQQASLDIQRALANAGFKNDFTLAQGNFDAGAGQFNAGAANQASMFNTGQANQTEQFNVDQQTQAANRALQAAGLIGNLGVQQDSGARADLTTVADFGAMQRAIEQAQRNVVPTQLQIAGNLYGAIPQASYIGQEGVTKSSPSLAQLAGQAAQSAAIVFSDRRLKRDVALMGLHDGLGVYRFQYLWDEDEAPPRIGVMADEVAILAPYALGPVVGGFATVDYARL